MEHRRALILAAMSILGCSAGPDAELELGTSRAALSEPMPLKHVLIIVKENHTFDNYFGSFPGVDGTLSESGENLCPTPAGTIECPHAPNVPDHDLCHSHSCGLVDWNQGQMDGWNLRGGSDTGDLLAYAQYHERDIPSYWAYARTYALGDHFFSGMFGPSFPGHLFTVAAQAAWAVANPPTDLPFKIRLFPPAFYGPHPYWGCDEWPGDKVSILAGGSTSASVRPCFDIPSLPDVLPEGVDWKFYGTNWDGLFSEIWSPFNAVSSIRNDPARWSRVVGVDRFSADLRAGALPSVAWLVDQDQNSEHPDLEVPGLDIPLGGVCEGENWTVHFVNQLMQSEYWNESAILVTWDDFGGWYDHVPPPRQYGGTPTAPYGLGLRMPLLIVSPYAKPGFVFRENADQASLARFVERVFGAESTLADLDPAAQDAEANDLFGAFDFEQQPLPPLIRPERDCN